MPYHKRANGNLVSVAGFVGVIGPANNPNYFTGSSYTSAIDDAKVFRTPRGCFSALNYWQTCDHNEQPLGEKFWSTRRAKPVLLAPVVWEILPE